LLWFCFGLVFGSMGFELRASHLLSRHPTTWTTPPACSGYFGGGVLQTISLSWCQTTILLISASQITRVTNINQWHQVQVRFLKCPFFYWRMGDSDNLEIQINIPSLMNQQWNRTPHLSGQQQYHRLPPKDSSDSEVCTHPNTTYQYDDFGLWLPCVDKLYNGLDPTCHLFCCIFMVVCSYPDNNDLQWRKKKEGEVFIRTIQEQKNV
jgi:hypothetical protein